MGKVAESAGPPGVPGVLRVTARSGRTPEILTHMRCWLIRELIRVGFDLWITAKILFGLVCLAPLNQASRHRRVSQELESLGA